MEYSIKKRRHSHRKKLFILLLSWLGILCIPPDVDGQAVLGARELAMGQATTALPNSSWSVFGNPAMISDQESTISFFGVRYYGLAEITDMAATINYPTDIGVFSAGAHRYGYDLFNESRLRVGYKHSAVGFHYGFLLNYNHVVQGGGYGSAGAFGIDLGVAAPVIPGLWIGAKAINLNQPTYGSLNDEELPRNLSVGFSYFLSDIALFSAEVLKDVRFPLAYRSGIEVNIIAGLMGRAGITTAPQTFAAGFGYESRLWGAGVGVQRHENSVLGYSPAIDFKVRW